MSSIHFQDFLSKLILIEQSVGANTTYEILDPFKIDSYNIIDIQKAAKIIAAFIGLKNFTFIIGIAKQEENVGGHIELQKDGTDVFIEISEESLIFPEIVLATLAHELTHKYLHIHHISCGFGKEFEYENEILTDITAVYLGLGKIMLNGCESQRKWEKQTFQGTQTHTQTLKSGYLTRSQFTIVYLLVCGMRQISESKYLNGLTIESKNAVNQCISDYKNSFKRNFHDSDEVFQIKKMFDETSAPIIKNLTNFESQISHVKEILEICMNSFLIKSRTRIAEMRGNNFRRVAEDVYNPALKYLLTAKCNFDVEATISEIEKLNKELEIHIDCILSAVKAIHKYDIKLSELPVAPETKETHSFFNRKWFRRKN